MSDSKLKTARNEIRAILERLDIAGYVLLHNPPGEFEVMQHLSPSYSVAAPVYEHGKLAGYKVSARATDFATREAFRHDVLATANLCSGFAELLSASGACYAQLSSMVDAAIGVEHTPMRKVEEDEHDSRQDQ